MTWRAIWRDYSSSRRVNLEVLVPMRPQRHNLARGSQQKVHSVTQMNIDNSFRAFPYISHEWFCTNWKCFLFQETITIVYEHIRSWVIVWFICFFRHPCPSLFRKHNTFPLGHKEQGGVDKKHIMHALSYCLLIQRGYTDSFQSWSQCWVWHWFLKKDDGLQVHPVPELHHLWDISQWNRLWCQSTPAWAPLCAFEWCIRIHRVVLMVMIFWVVNTHYFHIRFTVSTHWEGACILDFAMVWQESAKPEPRSTLPLVLGVVSYNETKSPLETK